tara:strand:- start:65 stop:1375 length:1311 start_codon:yes stop_codon:yes gene_type:complete
MLAKFFYIILLFLLLGCSSKEEPDLSQYVSINDRVLNLNIVNEKNKNDSLLQDPITIKNIYNPENYQSVNALADFPLEKIWEIDTNQSLDDKNPLLPKPIFISSYIYLLNNNGYLFKISGKTGKVIQKKLVFSNIENTIIGTPALSAKSSNNGNNILYLHNGFDELVAINETLGNKIWSKKFKLPLRGGMTVTQNLLLLSDFDGNFYSINNETGEINWSTFLANDASSVYTSARPILARDKIIVPGTGGAFFIISKDTGELLWTENISSNKNLPKLLHTGDIVANPIYNNGIIYIVSQSGITAAFDINTSEELWSVPVGGFETPSFSGSSIFINGNMGLLIALDVKTGDVRWLKQFPKYINEDSYFSEKEFALYKGPTLVNSHILFSNQNGKVMILDATTGENKGSILVDKLATSPMPADKKVFFLTANGKLIAYK